MEVLEFLESCSRRDELTEPKSEIDSIFLELLGGQLLEEETSMRGPFLLRVLGRQELG